MQDGPPWVDGESLLWSCEDLTNHRRCGCVSNSVLICILIPSPTQFLGCKLGSLDIPASVPLPTLSEEDVLSWPLPAL